MGWIFKPLVCFWKHWDRRLVESDSMLPEYECAVCGCGWATLAGREKSREIKA